jgi:glucose/arabinose dehydrogenase
MRVVRYVMEGEKLLSPRTLIDQIPAFLNHAGGRLAFGADGKLYVTTGDADRPPLAQDLTSLAGKILRLNPDGSIPVDNPFTSHPAAHPAIWSYGHRNAQGLAFDRDGALYAPEHGSDGGDEINLIRPGMNYGWPRVSHDRNAEGMIGPIAEFTPAIGPGDATFYRGEMFPEFVGELLVACMRGESLLRIKLDEAGTKVIRVERLLHRKFGRIREVKVAPDGAIWITTSEIDPPEGRSNPGYDQVIRLSRGDGPVQETQIRPVGGVALYAEHCARCHGTRRQPGDSSSLFDRQWQFGSSDNAIRRNTEDGVAKMAGFKSKLTPDEINEILRYIRNRESLYPR